ncbi:MAG: hypothetical protein L0154_04930 [Chloroflexi bacterium]|nr:hypothetical protein [Chloroflexota bacterium]
MQQRSLACPNCGSAMEVRMVSSHHKEGHCPVCDTRVDLSDTIQRQENPQVVNLNIPIAPQQYGTSTGGGCAGIIVGIVALIVVLVGAGIAFFAQSGATSSPDIDFQNPIFSNNSSNGLSSSGSSYAELKNSRPIELARQLTSMAYSPDGSLLAVGGSDNYLAMLDGETLEVLSTWDGVYAGQPSERDVMSLAFSPDGSTLAVGGWGGALELWNVESQQRLMILDHASGGSINDVIFTSDGTRLVLVTSSRNILVINVPGGDLALEITLNWAPETLALVNNDTQVAVGLGAHEQIGVYDLTSGNLAQSISTEGQIYSVVASPDGTQLAALAHDEVRLYDTSTWEIAKTLSPDVLSFGIEGLAFSQDGKYIAAGNFFDTGVIWEVESGAELVHFEDISKSEALIFNPNATQLFTIGGTYTTVTDIGEGNILRVWDVGSALAEEEEADTETEAESDTTQPTFTPLS